MKKSKILVATLTAAAIAAGCGAFAGCKKDPGKSGEENPPAPPAATTYDVTFDANGGSWANNVTTQKLTTGTDGKLTALPDPAPTREQYTFASYNTAQDGSGTTISLTYKYTAKTTVYAQWTEAEQQDPPTTTTEYTITLHVGNGVLPTGAATTYKTGADGKLVGTLPVPTISTAHMSFGDWYDAEEGGNAIDETTAVFTKDTDLYAHYIRDDGVWLGDTYKAGLTRNTGEHSGIQYWLGGGSITLAEDDVISLYMGGKLISYYVIKSSAGIDKPAESANVNSVTVTVAGEFKIYLWDWTTESDPTNWSCEFAGPTKIEEGSEIPEGCDAVHITFGTNEFTLYFKDASGNPIGAADFNKYCIYAWSGASQHFGAWAACTTKGVLAAEMSSTVTVLPEAWIIRWGTNFGTQTGNLSGIKAGGTYLIELAQGAGTVTEIVLEAAE